MTKIGNFFYVEVAERNIRKCWKKWSKLNGF